MNLFCTRRARFAKAPPGGAGFSVPPRKDRRGVDLIRDALPFGRLWYGEPNAVSNAIGYAMHRSRSHHAVIRVYDATGNVIETHEHAGDFKTVVKPAIVFPCVSHSRPVRQFDRFPVRREIYFSCNDGSVHVQQNQLAL